MTLRKQTPLHDKWHRRVEGQLRDVIHSHPEWFSFEDEHDKKCCINSIAKRVVGEIVADCVLASNTVDSGARLQFAVKDSDDTEFSQSRGLMGTNCGVPLYSEGNDSWTGL